MKKIVLILLSVFVSFQLSASDKKIEGDAKKNAHISFEKLVHDFGKIKVNSEVEYEFSFTNTGDIPLVLSQVRGSCGCTVPEWTKDPILPGESGVVKVKYTTVQRPHIVNKSVTVTSNADNATVFLKISGEITE